MKTATKKTPICEYCIEPIHGPVATLDQGYYDGADLHEGCAVYLYKSLGYEAHDRIEDELEANDDPYKEIREARQARRDKEQREAWDAENRLRMFQETFEVVTR